MSEPRLSATRRETIALIAGAAALPLLPAIVEAAEGELGVGADQAFDLGWRFFKGEGDGFELASLDDGAWRAVDLPHDWSIENLPNQLPPRRIGAFEASASGGTATAFTTGGEGWYRKRFRPSQAAPSACAEILFDGVYGTTDVWLNGQLLGQHIHGYTPFSFDLTPHLQRDGDNVIAVRVRNLGRNSRWYSGSGIYRPVRIDLRAEPARIARWGVAASTRRIANDRAEIEVATSLSDVSNGLRLRTRLKAQDGSIAAEAVSRARADIQQRLRVRAPELWSPTNPTLYTLESELLRGDQVIDRLSQPFGIRIIDFDAERGMTINGDVVKLRGGCVHHDNGLLGASAFADADERRVLLLKARGFNAIRSSHNPSSRTFRDACDRHGMLLIEEAFDMWHMPKNPDDYAKDFPEHWRADLAAMVLSARNSPSVIMWSIGNEIPGRASREGLEYSWHLANEVHTLDPTRPVTAAIHGFNGRSVVAGARTARPGQTGRPDGASVIFLDVPGFNYRLNDFEPDHAAHPDRVAYGSETFPREAYDYAALMARAPHVIGEFVWTSMDYLGEAGIGVAMRIPGAPGSTAAMPMMPQGFPWIGANCGDVDLIGGQKPQSLFRDVVWGLSSLELAVQRPIPDGQQEVVSHWGWSDELSSWTWPGNERRPLAVRLYTSGDRVDLTLNGASIESKTLTASDKMRADFNVAYAPGVLEAVAFRNGAEIGRKRLETVGTPVRLRVIPEKESVRCDRQALSYVRIEAIDSQGRVTPDAKLPLTISIEGPADLAAFGSANPQAMGSFQATNAQTFRGRALAILRGQGQSGGVRVQVSSPGLEAGVAAIALS